jgi:hypothetical protein
MSHSELAREHGHEAAVLSSEGVLDQSKPYRGAGSRVELRSASQPRSLSRTSRTSTVDPGIIAPGLSLATSSACSRLSAETNMYPPTISLDSTKGPSVVPDAVTTLPLV